MSGFPLAQGKFAMARFGDEQSVDILSRHTSITLTYDIVESQHISSVTLSYAIQHTYSQSITLYYLIAPTPSFTINGTILLAPDQITYTPRPVSNRLLSGSPVLQGYRTMIWTWSQLREEEARTLLMLYDPLNPLVFLIYPDETGTWVQRQVSMLPPSYGTRETVAVSGVMFSFTGLL